jgi:hypothetical protein
MGRFCPCTQNVTCSPRIVAYGFPSFHSLSKETEWVSAADQCSRGASDMEEAVVATSEEAVLRRPIRVRRRAPFLGARRRTLAG